jgi:hypothetical protein
MLIALIHLLFASGILPSLPLDDPAMPWLERWQGRPGCELSSVRPWAGEDVLACLEHLDTIILTPTDRIQVGSIRRRLDLRDHNGGYGLRPAWKSKNNQDLIALDLGASSYARFSGRALAVVSHQDSLGVELDTLSHDLVLGGDLHPRIDVILGEEVSLWSRLSQTTEISDGRRWLKSFDPDHGVYQTALFAKEGGKASYGRTSDWLEGALEVNSSWLRGQAGVQRLRWGMMPLHPMLFSGEAVPMGWTSVRKDVGPISSEVLYGAPIGETYAEDRKIYAHRTLFDLGSWMPLKFAFSEAMISNGRNFQPLYLMPVFPLLFTGHYVGTPDNLLMDFDASVRLSPKIELMGELFLDDLQNVLGFVSKDWGNKWGLSLGGRLTDMVGVNSLDLFQITRIEPWVYTTSATDLPGSAYTTPVHFGSLLGHPSGPNSLTLEWQHRQDLSPKWSWLVSGSSVWKGLDLGSSWRDVNGTGFEQGVLQVKESKKQWLSGDLAKVFRAGGGLEWRLGSQLRMDVQGGGAWQDSSGVRDIWPELSCKLSWRE